MIEPWANVPMNSPRQLETTLIRKIFLLSHFRDYYSVVIEKRCLWEPFNVSYDDTTLPARQAPTSQASLVRARKRLPLGTGDNEKTTQAEQLRFRQFGLGTIRIYIMPQQ